VAGNSAVDEVRYEKVGAVAVLTIDRQHRRNAVNGPTAERLLEGYTAFEADDEARVLVLTGAGPDAFCAGADLKELETLGERVLGGDAPLGFTRTTPTKPTIAAINGYCLAGGLELALWCDLRIAHPDAQLGFPERRWGVPLIDGGTQRLPRIVGMGRALDLILTGRIMHALEALDWGLLTELDDDPVARAIAIAQGLASFPQETMLADRRAAIEGFGLPLEEGLKIEAKAGAETLQIAVEGAQRFASGEGRGGAGAGV
jgi:enoyl-CoA hydratase